MERVGTVCVFMPAMVVVAIAKSIRARSCAWLSELVLH
jgi:hypothetical protein